MAKPYPNLNKTKINLYIISIDSEKFENISWPRVYRRSLSYTLRSLREPKSRIAKQTNLSERSRWGMIEERLFTTMWNDWKEIACHYVDWLRRDCLPLWGMIEPITQFYPPWRASNPFYSKSTAETLRR